MVRDIIDFVRPPEDASPVKHRRWRANVAMLLVACAAGTGVSWFPIGPYQHVQAGELDKKIETAVTRQIDEKIAPITKEQQEQRKVLDRVSNMLTEQLAQSVATQIRLTISKRCKTTGSVEREELNREKDRLQDLHVVYKGVRYIEPTCGDL